ncbi:MAG: ATP-binding protein [Candidatus Cloacimonetes bacterium]|nr:ATP-binding protein [Candidatus Cloacimonadota bacterium]
MVGELNSEQRKQLNIVKQSSRHLLDLINDILDISKIEAGRVELNPESFLLEEVTTEVTNIMRPKADEKNLQLINNPSDEIIVQTDRRRLKQVILNLVSNAIKFTNSGTIVITTDQATADTVEISVEDSGIGISKNDLFKLFEPFQQVDNSLTKKQEGTGLGLHLSHRLMELLGGRIEVNSTVNKGSVFTVILPIKRENNNE